MGHALAIADDALLMLGQTDFCTGPAADVLTEANLSRLYRVTLKKVSFEHEGRQMETFAPILPAVA